ncbi:ASPIC/UnbV domain-containing protein [Stieleria marina]
MNRTCTHPKLGEVDEAAGEFWVGNAFQIVEEGENLSAYERNRLYLGVDGSDFIDGSFTSNVDIDSDSRSVIAADINQDGALDLLVASVGGGPLRLFLNRIPQKNRLRLSLEGVESNRLGIGTRLIARVGDRRVVRDVFPANGFMGQAPAIVDLGIGDADRIDELSIRWPSGKHQILKDVDPSKSLHVVEGVAPK